MKLQNWWFTTLLGSKDAMLPPLRKDIKADVVIVGAGAAGISAAYALMKKGVKIVMLEKNIFGGNTSGKSAGFLTPDSELELAQLIRRFGLKGAADVWHVATTGIKMMVDRIHEHNIPCDLQVQDSLFLGNGKRGWKDIESEMAARKSMNFIQTLYDKDQVKTVIGTDAYSGGVRYPGTYGVDALLYCQGMKEVLLQNGVEIYESSEVVKIDDHIVKTHLGSVSSNDIIFCADKLQHSLTHFADDAFHAETFLTVSEPLSDAAINQLFPAGRFQCWDSDLIYTYYRLLGDNRLLLGGGNIRTTYSVNDVTSSHVINKVIKGFKKKFPQLKDLEFIQYWPGRIDTTRDMLPTIVKDISKPWLHFVIGCVGLPWATFCGDFAARHAYDDKAEDDHHYYEYFKPDRHFLMPLSLEKIFGKPLLFAINNAWAKYYQVNSTESKHKIKYPWK
ncbi:MAG TPA: FAD-binding oxidoreductase [Bacteroidia bacterium]|nr:FAD-binding oxidoreductase [Bacteroidia bacterium]